MSLLSLFLGVAMARTPAPAPTEADVVNALRCYHYATAAQYEAEKGVMGGKLTILYLVEPQDESQAKARNDGIAAVKAEIARLDAGITDELAKLARVEQDAAARNFNMPKLGAEYCSALGQKNK